MYLFQTSQPLLHHGYLQNQRHDRENVDVGPPWIQLHSL